MEKAKLPGDAGNNALGQLIRLIDDNSPLSKSLDEKVIGNGFRAARIGLTGPPGSGKSSLIASAVPVLEKMDKKVGILAVDPTSPFSGGAILGDRIRLKSPLGENIFFRSLASRGALEGVSTTIGPASRVLDWWGTDIILIETVGSGQLATGVADVADYVVAVLTPESGDGIQSMKAGVMELADCFILNKSERPGAELMIKELEYIKEESEDMGRKVIVQATVATEDHGINSTVENIVAHYNELLDSGEIQRRRELQVRREIESRIRKSIHESAIDVMGGNEKYIERLKEAAGKILNGTLTPESASEEILKTRT
ncbi:MAG TPA: methylmalonyl Co-A mutase-associated GTPase MeaB [bacterium]|jgi:LAO/AO transport system kinase